MGDIIEIKDVVKSYKLYDKPLDRLKEAISPTHKMYHKEFIALNGISFNVEKGDALGILGKNGSGKSTLLKMITGVLSPSSGTIQVKGKISAILELGAGFNPEYSGKENVYLNGLMMGFTREEIDNKMNDIIEFADIGEFIEQPVKIYSSGMFARLAFAVSINVDPEILIVDEALAVGDVRFQTKCIDKMKELKSRGTTILFVSHATEQVKRFCNKAVWLKDGVVQASGESSEIADLYEDFMKYNTDDSVNDESLTELDESEISQPDDFIKPNNPDILASITKVELNKDNFRTFDELEVEVEYDVYDDVIDDLLLGVAIYTPDREYIFGPNTHLEKIDIPNIFGRHRVKYIISSLPLLSGTFCIDVGLFNNEGIVCLDYKQEVSNFKITNKYFSEGLIYMQHKWEVIK
ncbi:ABC transporter ATP-binding protein [Paenibacillus macquariensis]|uniref:Teichoic acid transport system ATP-binding protein n=1 Tax=Paenibacillus macquariensis TaxID=948756 RepID=A0ABY1K6G0_9BACL|nr:ABC transporter ATP-binding protein [Paenibacillus macquariensis]MEC0093595.1 ABC transporter ATP-binding protein [Paenibacillus macquariensis]OAB35584.1 teichoic acid ABC transporter ATP-binding protein [Paenibacillus macquariensis subsp. macquariensis]SIR33091.1 teichoic acid transport system ATP-binding protein [Paenibacillus macquariensis]